MDIRALLIVTGAMRYGSPQMPTGDGALPKLIAWAVAIVGGLGTLLQGLGAVGVRIPEGEAAAATGKTPIPPERIVAMIAEARWSATWRTALGEGIFALGVALIVMNRRKIRRREAAAERVVRILHQRWFANESGFTPKAGIRVSMWAASPHAGAPKEWFCLAVSGNQKMIRWPHVTPETLDRLPSAGLVAATAYHGVGSYVAGLPLAERQDPKAMKDFCERTFITEAQLSNLSWPYASSATRVASRRGGLIECIVMVEREDGGEIEAELLDVRYEGDPCGGELDLVAAIWSETMGERS